MCPRCTLEARHAMNDHEHGHILYQVHGRQVMPPQTIMPQTRPRQACPGHGASWPPPLSDAPLWPSPGSAQMRLAPLCGNADLSVLPSCGPVSNASLCNSSRRYLQSARHLSICTACSRHVTGSGRPTSAATRPGIRGCTSRGRRRHCCWLGCRSFSYGKHNRNINNVLFSVEKCL